MAGDNFTLRMSDETHEALEARAEATGKSKAEIIRRYIQFGEASQADKITEQAKLEDAIERTIEQNRQLRNALPSKWRAHVRRLLADDLQDDASPEDIRTLADGYRRQAELYEELLESLDFAPDVEDGLHQQIVDDELRHAIEAADLSNWYDRVQNPFEHMEGVEAGRQEREEIIAVTRGVLGDLYEHRKFVGTDYRLGSGDISEGNESLLPDRISAGQFAELVNRLADEGVDPDEIGDHLATMDVDLEGDQKELEDDDVEVVDELPEADDVENDRDVGDLIEQVHVWLDGGYDEEQIREFFDSPDDYSGGDSSLIDVLEDSTLDVDDVLEHAKALNDEDVLDGQGYPDPDDDGQASLPARVPASDGGRSSKSPFSGGSDQ